MTFVKDVNKTSASKKCHICYNWYLLSYSFRFQVNICDRCHDLLMMSMNLIDIVILNKALIIAVLSV